MRVCLLLIISFVTAGQVTAQGRLTAKLDKFGNPIGAHSLAADGAFQGKRLLMWRSASGPEPIFSRQNPLFATLKRKGIEVVTKEGPFDPGWLQAADQLWIFSGSGNALHPEAVRAIVAYARAGNGLYLVADNAPYVAEANAIGGQLFGVSISGDYHGTKTVAVREGKLNAQNQPSRTPPSKTGSATKSAEALRKKLPGLGATIQNSQVSHYVEAHALLTGINFIYEGITISHLTPNDQLSTVLIASDGKPLAVVAKDKQLRVVIDCGYTRYFPVYVEATAGTLRYAENIAAYLMGASAPNSVIELLDAAVTSEETSSRGRALALLEQSQPSYEDLKDLIEQLHDYMQSDDDDVAKAARRQLSFAFQQAPISHCLHWIAQRKPGLDDVIWQQVNARIRRATASRRASYRKISLNVVISSDFDAHARAAAMELLLRLKDPTTTGPLIESLPQLPRELWAQAGSLLKELTGQDFGPHPGDGAAEVIVSARKWRAWLKSQN